MSDGDLDLIELRAAVAVACRALGREGVTRGPVGHVSVRIPDEPGRFLIKARGVEEEGLEFCAADDIIRVDKAGIKLDGRPGLDPPTETPLHLALYEARPEINCVVHVHPSWVVALSCAGLGLLPIYGAYDPHGLRLAAGGVPEYPSSVAIHDMDKGRQVAQVIGDGGACVLRGHGAAVVGGDLEEAARTTMALHELGRMNWLAASVGPRITVTAEEQAELIRPTSPGHKRSRARRADGHTAFWHFLQRRAGTEQGSDVRGG
jgi:ribulose-5-phosphate 4-epimerase/fuculose-1-phosphate aldolase